MKFLLNRRAFAFVISMVVLFCLTNLALHATDKNAHTQDVCCAYINIDVSVTPDCCVLITIDDPYCNASLHLYQRLKPDGTYETLSMQTGGTTTSFKICPNPGETFVSYRVRITADWDTTKSACFTSFYAKTEKIGTIDLSCCGPCPDMSSWLTVKAVKDNSCPNYGCKLKYNFVIPESNNCFVSYKVGSGPNTPLFSKTLSGNLGCISSSSSGVVTIKLFKANGDSCIVSKSADCDPPIVDSAYTPTPCTPDCFDTPFVMPPDVRIFSLPGCPGCFVRVTYTYRKQACGVYQDLQILSMEMSPSCELTCGIDYIYKQALLGIISLNIMGFDPKAPAVGCNTTWRISQGGCWSHWQYYIVDPTHGVTDSINVWQPCKLSACCLVPMTVCRDAMGNITVTNNSSSTTPPFNCIDTWLEDPYTHWIFPCYPKCDWLGQFNEELLQHGTANSMFNVDSQSLTLKRTEGDFGIGIGVEVKDNIFAVMLKNEKSQNAQISIFDIKGTLVSTLSSPLHTDINYLNIDVSKLISGAYTYAIVVDGKQLKSDKFIIQK